MALVWRSGNILAQMPHRVRLWRQVRRAAHDGNRRTPTYRDVYSIDIPCRIQPDSQLLMGSPQGLRGPMPANCLFPARDSNGARIRPLNNDVLEIKWTRQDGPRRRTVETTLTSSAAAATTDLNVADTWGFESEELVVIENAAGTDWHIGLVEAVSGDVVSLRSNWAVPAGQSFASGDAVKVSWTARILGTRNPIQSDIFHTLSIQKCNDGEWLLK